MSQGQLDRRAFFRSGNISLFGSLTAGLALSARAGVQTHKQGRAKACILLFQVGGPYQCDTLDPKPRASEEIRGPFKPIATAVPGMQISAALPKTASLARHWSVIRSVHHRIRCHNPAIYCSLVGREATDAMAISNRTAANRTDHPHYASVLSRLKPGMKSMPRHVIVPDVVFNGPARSPGLTAGFLGSRFDPFILGANPTAEDFAIAHMSLPENVSAERLRARNRLLNQLDNESGAPLNGRCTGDRDESYRQAFDVLATDRFRQAFDLEREPARLRDRYGRHLMGQGALLARRLIEAGVPFVTVFSHTRVEKESWDTHNRHDELCKEVLLPPADQSLSAMIEDLHVRGMLPDVLVLWMGEFGRTPRRGVNFSNNTNNVGGRDHWCNCYSVLLAGGGVQGGRVIGSSDANAGYPQERPVHVSDLAATIYHALGIDPRSELHDIQGQVRSICDGHPVTELFS